MKLHCAQFAWCGMLSLAAFADVPPYSQALQQAPLMRSDSTSPEVVSEWRSDIPVRVMQVELLEYAGAAQGVSVYIAGERSQPCVSLIPTIDSGTPGEVVVIIREASVRKPACQEANAHYSLHLPLPLSALNQSVISVTVNGRQTWFARLLDSSRP